MNQVPFAHAVMMEDHEDSREAIAAADAAARQQVFVAPPPSGVERLPSNLTYKDQGRDLQSVLQQGGGLERLPSNLSYKDQGRELHSVLQVVEPQAAGDVAPPPPNRLPALPSDVTYKQQGSDLVSIPGQQQPTPRTTQSSVSPSPPASNIISQYPSVEPTQYASSWWQRLLARKKWILPVVIFVVMIVLAVVVSTALSGGDEENSREETTTTTFEGTAGLFLVLEGVTKTMTGTQSAWYETILAGFLEERLVSVDRPFLEAWRVVLTDQLVVANNDDPNDQSLRRRQQQEQGTTTVSLATKLTVRIPFDTDTNQFSLTEVETLLQTTLEANAESVKLRLVDTTDSPSIRAYFATVLGIDVYPATTSMSDWTVADGETIASYEANSTGATVQPTKTLAAIPTSQPTTSPPTTKSSLSPTNKPTDAPTSPPTSLPYFTSRQELRAAVVAYANDPVNRNSVVAQRYGHPIGTWDVSRVTDMSCVFYAEGPECSESPAPALRNFNEDISNWSVGQVTNMQGMFRFASSFNQPLSTWSVARVTNMAHMFYDAHSFNQDVSGWSVDRVTRMNSLFCHAYAFNQDVSGWRVGQVETMLGIFWGATVFNQNLCSWGTQLAGSSTIVTEMFYEPTSCPSSLTTPSLTTNPPGPFCHVCT